MIRLSAIVSFAAVMTASGLAAAQEAPVSLLPEAVDCASRLRAAEARAASGNGERVRLADICGDLADELGGQIWGRGLVAAEAEELSARPFAELVQLIEFYARRGSAAPGLDAGALGGIVESLGPFEPVAELSPWERMLRWVGERLGLDEPQDGNRLVEWLRRLALPKAWAQTIVVIVGLAALAAVAAIVANELGVRRARARRRGEALPGVARVPRTPHELGREPAWRQPTLLLALLFERCRERFGAAVRTSMTGRELVAAAGSLGIAHRRELESIVDAAERVAFAGWRPEPGEARAVVKQGLAVLDELTAVEPGRRKPAAEPARGDSLDEPGIAAPGPGRDGRGDADEAPR